jgi:hypothetical protein
VMRAACSMVSIISFRGASYEFDTKSRRWLPRGLSCAGRSGGRHPPPPLNAKADVLCAGAALISSASDWHFQVA